MTNRSNTRCSMLIEKEVIAPGNYWYLDQKTGVPRKLSVTSEHTKYWQQQGKSMLDTGLQVPVPYEHDFNVHPMSTREALLNNAGDVKEYRLKDFDDPIRGKVKDALFSVVEVKDRRAREKIKDGSIRWTSPWINTFTDGNGKTWNNVITHLALTTRPRITQQQPFGSVAAALSIASEIHIDVARATGTPEGGLCLSRAGLLLQGAPAYPLAFSLYTGVVFAEEQKRDEDGKFASEEEHKEHHSQAVKGHRTMGQYLRRVAKHTLMGGAIGGAAGGGIGGPVGFVTGGAIGAAAGAGSALSIDGKPMNTAFGEFPPPKKDKPKPGADKPPPPGKEGGDKPPVPGAEGGDDPELGGDGLPGTKDDSMVDLPPLGDKSGDVSMEEVLCDLLRALGVDCAHDGDEAQFKRNLYAAAMKKVHDLTSKGMGKEEDPKPGAINAGKPPGSPGQPGSQPNPLVQQEQQPMYMGINMSAAMSLEDINKLDGPLKAVALSMYADNQKIRAEAEANAKKLKSLEDVKVKEEAAKRAQRIAILSRVSPKMKADLEAMAASPSFALSMGDGGTVNDPMAQTLNLLEKQLGDLPTLMVTDSAALNVQPQPRDGDEASQEEMDRVAESLSRSMGNLPEKKAS